MSKSKRELTTDTVYRELRDMILKNQYRAGEKLVDREVAERLGVSRTPVREALGRLLVLELVEQRSGRGHYVKEYSVEQVVDLFQFRKMLEVNAARLAAQNLGAESERRFNGFLSESEKLAATGGSAGEVVELDLRIHEQIAAASGSVLLHKAIREVLDKVICLLWVAWTGASLADAQEHDSLIRYILKKDSEAAAKAMSAHIDTAQDGMVRIIKARALPPAINFGGRRDTSVEV